MQTRSGAKAAPAAKDSERTYGREEISSTVQSALYSIGAALLAKIAASERPACEAVVRVTVGKEAQAASHPFHVIHFLRQLYGGSAKEQVVALQQAPEVDMLRPIEVAMRLKVDQGAIKFVDGYLREVRKHLCIAL